MSEDLDELLADARALLDVELAAARPPTDVLDVLQRARVLSDDAPPVSEPDVELHELAPPLDEELERDEDLVQLNADARLLLDGLLERRPTVRRRPSRALAAVAAMLVLGFASAAYASKKWQELEAAAESERFAAAAIAELDRTWRVEAERSQSFARLSTTAIIPVEPPPKPAPTVDPTVDPTPDVESDSAPAAKLDLGDRLAQLDAQAYAALRAGQHDRAAQRFETIVAIGGTSEYAELAFGELFALARRGSSGEIDKLWRSYLKRFPRGRYADAARAGLCRRTPQPNDRACWTEYLLEHPHGAARSEALRATEDG